jgi:hypothetical protein
LFSWTFLIFCHYFFVLVAFFYCSCRFLLLLVASWRFLSLISETVLCRSLFVLLYFFFWPLFCLFFFDIRILITPLVSSNSSWRWQKGNQKASIEGRTIDKRKQKMIYKTLHRKQVWTLVLRKGKQFPSGYFCYNTIE